MKQTIYILSILLCILSFESKAQQEVKTYEIPTQFLQLYHEIGIDSLDKEFAVGGFEISEQITFKEYKRYLQAIKKDSSIAFYTTQLPDSSIGSLENWNTYITDPIYEAYPVLGISWDNAMNYCNWRTVQENGDSIQFIYRLPLLSEWLSANYYLNKEHKTSNDFNKNYADWTLNSKDESLSQFSLKDYKELNVFEYVYSANPEDPPAMKRKVVVGNSYLYQMKHPLSFNFSFYEYEGYRQIAFRIVKDYRMFGAKKAPKAAIDLIKK